MPHPAPPLAAIRAFDACARHMSMARAGQELHLSAAAVSHQIKLLEHWMGYALFERLARGVVLTDAGRDYATRIHEVFDRLLSTTHELRAGARKPVVHVRAQLSLASLWLLPKLVQFGKDCPDIDLRLTADRIDDIPGEHGADLSIYPQRKDVRGYRQEPLLASHYAAFAAPQWVATHDIQTPADVLTLPMLHTRVIDRSFRFPSWEDWLVAAKLPQTEPVAGLQTSLFHLTQAACEQSAGAALLLAAYCKHALAQGVLVQLPGPEITNPYPFHLLSKNTPSSAAAQVREWLLSQGDH